MGISTPLRPSLERKVETRVYISNTSGDYPKYSKVLGQPKAGVDMRLNQVSLDDQVEITAIDDPMVRKNLRVMGVTEGTSLHCLKRLRKGPMVIRTGSITLAVGPELAEGIEVALCPCKGHGRPRGWHVNCGRTRKKDNGHQHDGPQGRRGRRHQRRGRRGLNRRQGRKNVAEGDSGSPQ